MLSGLFRHNPLAVALITGASLVIIFVLVLGFIGRDVLFATHLGEGAFYRVVPFAAMTIPPLVIAFYGLVVFVIGAVRFWRETGGALSDVIDLKAFWRATQDAFGLSYMKGGGAGCNYPDAELLPIEALVSSLGLLRFFARLRSHQRGCLLRSLPRLAGAVSAFSWPVVLGTVGGVGLLIGTSGLLFLKWKSDRDPAEDAMLSMDVAFLVLLFLTSLTGMILTRSARDLGDGNSFGHSLGSGRRPVYYLALWQVRSRGLPLCSASALRHRTAADGAVMIVEANPDIVIIPEGFFLMGSESGPENEMPRHRVWVDSFGLGKFPVTNREYRIFVEAEQAPAPPFWSDAMFSEPEQPVVGVNWDEATAYCKWLSRRTGKEFRLPSEAEWERAARGKLAGALYPWGDEPPCERPYAGYDLKTGGPQRVGANVPNDFGLYDMSEGVHEWCSDYYDAGYYHYAPEKNPQGPCLRTAACFAWRFVAPPDQIQPLRRKELSAAEFQIRGLRLSRGADAWPVGPANRRF